MTVQQSHQSLPTPSFDTVVRRVQGNPKHGRHQGKRVSFSQGQDTQRCDGGSLVIRNGVLQVPGLWRFGFGQFGRWRHSKSKYLLKYFNLLHAFKLVSRSFLNDSRKAKCSPIFVAEQTIEFYTTVLNK